MDKCELVKRRVLIRKSLAVLLVSCAFLADVLCGVGRCGNPADEAAKAALRAEITAVKGELLSASKGILQESVRMELYNTLLLFDDALHNYFIDFTYKIDHKELGDKVFNDQADSLANLYGSLGSAGEFSFESAAPSRSAFDAKNPGYRVISRGNPIIFSEKYKERVKDLLDFAYGSLKENNGEARGFLDDSHPLSPSNVKKLHDASVKAGNPVTTQGGYRQVMQAGNQIIGFANQEAARLRADLMRLGESRLKIAMNERQEEMDVHAAFEQALVISSVSSASAQAY
jgi:hypothetical protein